MSDPIDFLAVARGVVAYLQTPGAVALIALCLFAGALSRVVAAGGKTDRKERNDVR